MQNILDFIEGNKTRYIEELKELLRIPTISTSPDFKGDIEKCAQFLKEHLNQIGMKSATIYPTDGHPVVYADWLAAGEEKPTILIYGHYDVQPVDPIELWTTPPFEPTIRDGKIYARGAVDDKGQLFVHLKALEAHLKQNEYLPVNVKIILEGEEEIGSEHLEVFLRNNIGLLKADVAVISDTAMYSKDIPALTYGLRGLCYMEIEVTGPNRDLHSGTYGGAIDNPINALSHIISKLKDERGRIMIDGFYDDVVPLTDKERGMFAGLPFDEENYKRKLGVDKLFGEEGFTVLERIWSRPTLDCNGIWGGFTNEGAKTVLPSKAYAKVSMRLVPNQEPHKIAKLFENYVNKIAPRTINIKVKSHHHGKSVLLPVDSKWIQSAYSALKMGFGREPVFIREGGTIPVVVFFKEILNIPTVLLGFGLPDENTHSPDEHFDLDNFHKGIVTAAYYYEEISKIQK